MVREHKGKVRVVYKNFMVHPDTVMDAHLAGCAAHKQGKFEEFKNAYWKDGYGAYAKTRDPSKIGKENLIKIAASVGLDTAKLAKDMEGQECKDALRKDMSDLMKFHVNGTPSFFINGKFTMFAGPGPFNAEIEKALAEVEKSGVPADQYYQKVVLEKGSKEFVSAADAKKSGK